MERAQGGRSTVITKRGRVVAKLVPASGLKWDRAAILDEADALRKTIKLKVRVNLAKLLAAGRLRQLAGRHGLSAYDATYLALAIELKLPLACGDRPLKAALPRAGVRLA